jgi:hypothetical protein
MSDPTAKTSIRVKGIKINTLIPPASLVGLVPPEPAPAGTPVIDVELEGSSIVLRATLNGKSVRKALKSIAELGVDGVNAVLQGNLKPGEKAGDPFILDSAGLAITPKAPKSTEAS